MVENNRPANAGAVGDAGSSPRSGRSPGVRNGNQLQYSFLGNFHGERSLMGYSPWDCKESDMTRHMRAHTHTAIPRQVNL